MTIFPGHRGPHLPATVRQGQVEPCPGQRNQLRAGESARERLVGERGFEPPTPWSRTRCSTRLSHSPTEVSPFILLHVTSHVLCSENPETWDHWDHPPVRTVLEPAPFADETRHRSACIRTWFLGSSVQFVPAGDLPAS